MTVTYVIVFSLVTVITLLMYRFWRYFHQGKQFVSVFYRSVLVGSLITALFILSNVMYQNNTWGLRDNILNLEHKTTKEYKKHVLKNDKTSRNTIRKMVMRQAQKGLEKQGFVAVPSRYILLPIYNSAYTDQGLNAGANYANKSADDPSGKKIPVMGVGNYGLAAHNFNDGKTGFSALQEISNNNSPYISDNQLKGSSWLNGKTILLSNNSGIYRYIIDKQITVTSSQVDVLNATAKPQLTVISCLFPSTNYRIITKAHLKKAYTWDNAPQKYVDVFNLKVQNTNAHADWWNPGTEEGANGDAGGTKK